MAHRSANKYADFDIKGVPSGVMKDLQGTLKNVFRILRKQGDDKDIKQVALTCLLIGSLEGARFAVDDAKTYRPANEYTEELGAVCWWRLPVTEAPYVGWPTDDGFRSDHYTHWTRLVAPETDGSELLNS